MFKQFAVALAAVAAVGAANATTYDLGVISTDVANPTVDTFLVAKGSFVDEIDFQVAAPSVVDASANAISLRLRGVTVNAIPDLWVQVWDNVHPFGVHNFINFAGNDTTVSFSLPAAGQYHLDITGTAIAKSAYTVALVATPVPEPETYALMLAGIGAIGFVARRRKAA